MSNVRSLLPAIARSAALLSEARRSREPLRDPLGLSSIEDALAVQARQPRGPIGGWKCGLPAEGRLIVAPIAAASIKRADHRWHLPSRTVLVEPEIAFVLAQTIDCPPSRAALIDKLAGAHLALELVHGRFLDPSRIGFFDMLADDLFNEGLVLGPAIDVGRVDAIGAVAFDEAPPEPVAHPARDPLAPLLWLAGYMAGRGTPLEAGMAVITGALVAPLRVGTSGTVSIHFGPAGSIRLEVELKGSKA